MQATWTSNYNSSYPFWRVENLWRKRDASMVKLGVLDWDYSSYLSRSRVPSIAAWAAASRAMGTRNGEQLT